MPVSSVDEAFEAAHGDILLKERFCAAWELTRSNALSLVSCFNARIEAHLGEACILSWGPERTGRAGRSQQPEAVREVIDVYGVGRLELKVFTDGQRDKERLARTLHDLVQLCQFSFDHSLRFQSLANSMAHDMTILLTGTGLALRAIDGALEGASAAQPSDGRLQRTRHVTDQVLAEAQLGLYLVRNYVSYTNPHSAPRYFRSRVDLNEALDGLLGLHARIAVKKGVEIEPAIGEPLPPVDGDADELRRALHNMFSNAVKYSYRSSHNVQRTVRVERIKNYDSRSHRCAIAISNYGLGIEADEASSVFRPGFRGRQAREEVATGTGIGLAETQKIANAHAGKVTFRSRPVHVDDTGRTTYLTKVTLVLPYRTK